MFSVHLSVAVQWALRGLMKSILLGIFHWYLDVEFDVFVYMEKHQCIEAVLVQVTQRSRRVGQISHYCLIVAFVS